MIEWLTFPAIVFATALIPNRPGNDRKKIETIFKNVGYGVPQKNGNLPLYPRFRKKFPIEDCGQEIGTTYRFKIPLGLPATKMSLMEKEGKLFADGLGKPVITEFNKKLGLFEVKVFKEDIPEMFKYRDVPSVEGWKIPLGKSLEGMVWHNFDHTPHMTVAGTTRFGKTVFLKSSMTYLIEHHPDDVEFYIIDLKGGLEFNPYKKLEQVKEVAKDGLEAFQLLEYLHYQMALEYMQFLKNGWNNIVNTNIQKRRFIIIDEGAQLTPEKFMKAQKFPEMGKVDGKDISMFNLMEMCQFFLGEIARIGGALGYREIFCTQYPTADTLPRQVKMNADAKVSFRLPTDYASKVAIDEHGAEELPSDFKGRALFKTHQVVEMQAPFITDNEMWKRLGKYQEPVRILEGVAFENVVDNQETSENGTDTNHHRQVGIYEQKSNPNDSFFEIREKHS